MSKNTPDKAHIQQSLARKLWKQVKRRFHKPSDHPINDASMVAIHQDLALVEEDAVVPASNNRDYAEFEVEITLDELQSALAALEQQSQKMSSADDALKQLIETLKQSEKTTQENTATAAQKPEMEVVVEFIPLPTPGNSPITPKAEYREIQVESVNDKLKREKEQRELAKRITHYPPSDRLH